MPQNKVHNSQYGNAFIIILAGVFLFAALMFTFSKSGQKGTGNLTRNQAKIAAQEILNYAQLIEGAVNRVRRNGCSENEISFENDIVAGYENPDSPSDKTCHVFEPEGGKGSIQKTTINWTNGSQDWGFNSEFQVSDIGSTCNDASCADLSLNLADINGLICEEINKSLFGNNAIPINSDYNFRPFVGSFFTPIDIASETSSAFLESKSTGCFYSNADSQNIFYHILLAR